MIHKEFLNIYINNKKYNEILKKSVRESLSGFVWFNLRSNI